MDENWKRLLNRDDILSLEIVEGYLWQGINGGLVARNLQAPPVSRFYHPGNTELPVSRVHALAADETGGLWAAAENGVVYRDNSGAYEHFHPENSPLSVPAVKSAAVDPTGGVWFGTWGGGAYYLGADQTWTTYNRDNSPLASDNLYRILPLPDESVWFATDGAGAFYRSPDGSWTGYNTRNSELPADDVLDIAKKEDGTTWFATARGLAGLSEEGDWQVYTDAAGEQDLPSTYIQCLEPAEDGGLWIGTGRGLAKLCKEGELTAFTPENSPLPAEHLGSLVEDESGALWVGTLGGGLALWEPDRESWTVFQDEPLNQPGVPYLPANAVNDIMPVPAENDYWISTERGPALYDGDTGYWKSPVVPAVLAETNALKTVHHRQAGTAYATTDEGLFLQDPQGHWAHYTPENSPVPSHNITDITFDEQGGLWLATRGEGALYRCPAGQWEAYTTEDGLPSDYLNAVHAGPAAKVWLATWDSGAAVLDLQNSTPKIKEYNTANSPLPADDVSALHIGQDQAVWLATWNGLARLSSDGDWTLYSAEEGHLPSNEIRALAEDSRGWLWAATPDGAASYQGDTWQQYDSAGSGLPAGELFNVSADQNGNLWFALAQNGIVLYHPDGLAPELLALEYPCAELDRLLLVYQKQILDDETLARIETGRTLVPIRVIAEATGARVDWDQKQRLATITGEKRTLELAPDEHSALVDGKSVELDVPARLAEGRILVPLRFVTESLGLDVTWDEPLQAIYLE